MTIDNKEIKNDHLSKKDMNHNNDLKVKEISYNLPNDIANTATILFIEHWFDKNVDKLKSFIMSFSNLRNKEKPAVSEQISCDSNIKTMMEGIGISKKYLQKIINNKHDDSPSSHTVLSAIREVVRACFYIKCGDLLHKIEEEDGMFPWTKTLHDADLAIIECLAMASVQHDETDICMITKLIIRNQNIWKNHFKGEGFIGYIRFLGIHPLRRRHQQNLLEPIKKLIEDLKKEDNCGGNDQNNTSGSGHFSNFIILSKLLQKCLQNVINKTKWTTADGSDAYKSKEVIEMFKIINEVYMSLPQGDPSSAVTHTLFYKIILRRSSLINLWISINYNQSN